MFPTSRALTRCLQVSSRKAGFVLLGVSLLFLCSLGSFAQQPTVTLLGPFGSWGPELQEALDRFAARHQVKAELLVMASWDETMEHAATMTAAGVAPDLLYGSATPLHFYALNNLSQPLDAMVARDLDPRVFPPSVLEGMRLGGSLYGLPTALSPSHTYYNTDHFAAAGIAPLPVDWRSEAFDWDDFVVINRRLTRDHNGDGAPDQFGVHSFGRGGGWNRLGMWGLDLFNPEMTEFYGERPEIIAAMEEFTSLWTEHGVIGGNFMRGTASMTLAHANQLNSLIAQQESASLFSWSVGVLPKGTKRLTYTAFHGIALSNASRHPELAWELLKYLTYDPEGAVLFSRAENRIPVIAPAREDFVRRFSEWVPAGVLVAFSDSGEFAYDAYISRHPNGAQIQQLLDRELAKPTQGNVSVQQVMNQIAPVIRALLAER